MRKTINQEEKSIVTNHVLKCIFINASAIAGIRSLKYTVKAKNKNGAFLKEVFEPIILILLKLIMFVA